MFACAINKTHSIHTCISAPCNILYILSNVMVVQAKFATLPWSHASIRSDSLMYSYHFHVTSVPSSYSSCLSFTPSPSILQAVFSFLYFDHPSPTLPSPTLPSSTLPSSALPSPTLPSSTLPSPTLPSPTLPSPTLPSPTLLNIL